ncbi:MAG: hypothetical protein K6G26_03040 [Lachnospiraceae bacterium]|nr:hypothetical protein [Lachnospiraceae bacterium]
MENDDIIKYYIDCANKAYNSNQYVFTNFLGMGDIDILLQNKDKLSFAGFQLYGGYEGAERCVARFGDAESFGYEMEFPVTCLLIKPLMDKFSDNLNHRDYLGALINLGIKREVLGDIVIKDKSAYVFCLERMADFIMENLTRVKHTSIMINKEHGEITDAVNIEDIKIMAASKRCDIIVSKVYNISRNSCNELFRSRKIFVNGRIMENNSYMLNDQDTVSVRGYGKFIYKGSDYISKKGKMCIIIGIFR